MKVKKYLSVIVVLLMFLSGLPTISVPASFPSPWVKVFVDQPLGYIPSVAPGTHFRIDIMIVTSGFVDAGSPSIVGWGLDLQVNPDVISINTTAPPPPPFPPPPPDAKLIGSEAGYVMYDFNPPDPYPILSELDPGEANATSGYWDDISEVLMPLPSGGIGDYMTNVFYGGPAKLITFEVTSKSDTQGCLIDLINVEFLTPDNVWHPVDIVIDGYYGTTPPSVPEFPIGLALEILFIPVIIYIFWRSKQRKKLLP